MPDTKKWIALAVALQAVAIIATLWLYRSRSFGAELATRNTARVAAVFFAWAFAMRLRPEAGQSAMFGFVAAHAMHFMSVVYYSLISAKARYINSM